MLIKYLTFVMIIKKIIYQIIQMIYRNIKILKIIRINLK